VPTEGFEAGPARPDSPSQTHDIGGTLTTVLQVTLTVLLLIAALVAGVRFGSVRRVAVPLTVLWAAVMVTNALTARVADDGDWGAFAGSAVVVIGLALGLAWIGARFAARRV
jgi:hypothetical protein